MDSPDLSDELERMREALVHVREDREQAVAGLHNETGWLRDHRLRRIAELDAVIEKLQKRIDAAAPRRPADAK